MGLGFPLQTKAAHVGCLRTPRLTGAAQDVKCGGGSTTLLGLAESITVPGGVPRLIAFLVFFFAETKACWRALVSVGVGARSNKPGHPVSESSGPRFDGQRKL